jgi:hypothetical protein
MDSIIANPKTKAESKAVLDFLKSMKIDVEVYEKPSKEKVLKGIEQGFKELKMHKKGKLKLQNFSELLDEL